MFSSLSFADSVSSFISALVDAPEFAALSLAMNVQTVALSAGAEIDDLSGCNGLENFFTKTEVTFEDVAIVAASITTDETLAQNIVSAAVVSLTDVIEIDLVALQDEFISEFDIYQSCALAYFDAQADFDDVSRLSFLTGLAELKSSEISLENFSELFQDLSFADNVVKMVEDQISSSTFASLKLLTSMVSSFGANGGIVADIDSDFCSAKIDVNFWSTKASFDIILKLPK